MSRGGGRFFPGSMREERYPRAVQSEAPGNYVMLSTGPNQLAAQSQGNTNANGVVLAAVAVVSKFTGVFRAHLNCYFADDTTAISIKHSLVAVPYTPPINTFFAGGQATFTFAGNDTTQDLHPLTDWGESVGADTHGLAANGISYNGIVPNLAAAGVQVVAQKTVATLTNLLSANAIGIEEFCWSGRIIQTINPKTRLARGKTMVLAFVLNSLNQVVEGADTITYQHLSLGLEEEAYP